MRNSISVAHAVLNARLGWAGGALDPARLESAIEATAAKLQLSCEVLIDRVEQSRGQEFETLVSQLAVGETYFFRDRAQFRVIDRLIREASTRLRVLCAGCATGEEPYSVAILMLSRGTYGRVLGVDVNPVALEVAREGTYSSWSLRETPDATRDSWFETRGRRFALREKPRQLVELRRINLYDDDLAVLGEWDLVLCRNVLMYHDPLAAGRIVNKLAQQIRPGGYLFLGHAETLRGVSDAFDLLQEDGAFYYRRRSTSERTPVADPVPAIAPPPGNDSWFDAIDAATHRIAALTSQTEAQVPQEDARTWRSLVWAKVTQGDPAAALNVFESAPRSVQQGLLIVRAGLLLMAGREAEARQLASDLVTGGIASADAHYVLGLCESQAGRTQAAVDLLKQSHALDHEFAMPLVQGGFHLCRLGNVSDGRRMLVQAAELLDLESEQRILLFGGGFSREALQRICRATGAGGAA